MFRNLVMKSKNIAQQVTVSRIIHRFDEHQDKITAFVNHGSSFKFQEGSVCDTLLLEDGLSKHGLNKLLKYLDIPFTNGVTDVYTGVNYNNVSSDEGWQQQGRYRY